MTKTAREGKQGSHVYLLLARSTGPWSPCSCLRRSGGRWSQGLRCELLDVVRRPEVPSITAERFRQAAMEEQGMRVVPEKVGSKGKTKTSSWSKTLPGLRGLSSDGKGLAGEYLFRSLNLTLSWAMLCRFLTCRPRPSLSTCCVSIPKFWLAGWSQPMTELDTWKPFGRPFASTIPIMRSLENTVAIYRQSCHS